MAYLLVVGIFLLLALPELNVRVRDGNRLGWTAGRSLNLALIVALLTVAALLLAWIGTIAFELAPVAG